MNYKEEQAKAKLFSKIAKHGPAIRCGKCGATRNTLLRMVPKEKGKYKHFKPEENPGYICVFH